MGQEGQALIFLTENEACYVDFLRLNKGLALECYPSPPTHCVRERARDLVALDRFGLFNYYSVYRPFDCVSVGSCV